MARYLVKKTIRNGSLEYRQGIVVDLTPSQVTALGASSFRAANNPVNMYGTAIASPTHDTQGEASGVSNSS